VFGRPLVDDARVKPFTYSGFAAISARYGANEAVIAMNYGELVDRTVRKIGARVNAAQVKLDSPAAFLQELKRELMDDAQQPHPGFLWDLESAKHASIFPIFIYDVAGALGVPAGMEVGEAGIHLYLCGKGIKVEGKRLKIGERLESDRDAKAPIYDKAEVQSAIYAMAADEKLLGLELEASLALYRKAIAICPENADARCGIARALLELGKNEDALVEARIAISLEPHLDKAHGHAGLALAMMGDNYGAIERYTDAAEFAGTDAKRSIYHYNLAVAYWNLGQLNDAKNSCTQSIRSDHANADAYGLRSQINLKFGLSKLAEEDLRRYEELRGSKGERAEGNP
jgi:tetratricopeptide (TPR) repeat protein